jgi:flagellar biosynthetic protein FliP
MKGWRLWVPLAAIAVNPTAGSAMTLQFDPGPRVAEPLEWAGLLTLIALAPALLVMLTSFTRIVIVLSLLRQALGLQQQPPNMVLTGIALFLTAFVMMPVWKAIKARALEPYLAGNLEPSAALLQAEAPLREFMLKQTRKEDLAMSRLLLAKSATGGSADDSDPRLMPFYALVPAFISSELTAAFRIGFLIYLPFMAIDLAISAILMALGMFMLPPTLISLPLKLLVFTLASGWPLLLRGLMLSFS